MQRILVVNVNYLGDVVLAMSFIRVLRENFPGSFIASIIPQRCSEILKGCPYLDKIIYFDEHATHRRLRKKIQFTLKLRKERFDTAFILKPSLTRTLMLKCAGIKKLIGFDNPKSGCLLTEKIKPLPKEKMHRVDYHLGILEGMGLKIGCRDCEFFIDDSHRQSIKEKLRLAGLRENEPFVILNPGASVLIKHWPVENFARLAHRISEEFSLKAVITGGSMDINLGRKIEELSPVKLINFCGISLKELAALCERAEFVVSVDTGPMHIATSMGAKVIALFGPSNPNLYGPYPLGRHIVIQKDVGCSIPCYNLGCSDVCCMKAISVEDVIEKVPELIKTKAKDFLPQGTQRA